MTFLNDPINFIAEWMRGLADRLGTIKRPDNGDYLLLSALPY